MKEGIMAKLIVADPGHGWGKFYDGSERCKFESMLGEKQGSLMGGQHSQIATDEGHWLIGKSARIQSRNKMTGVDESWVLSPKYRALMLYGISRFVPAGQKQITINLASTLAIRDYKRSRAEVVDSLNGEHKVEIDGQQEIRIIINNVRMLPQGFAPASSYIASGRYNITTDLGTRNINFSSFDGKEIVFAKTDSSEDGAISVLQNIAQHIADQYGVEYHPIDLIERDIIQTGMIRVYGENKNIQPIIDHEKDEYFNAYLSLVSNTWRHELPRIDNIIVFGGGDYLIGVKIAARFPQVVRLPRPQWAQVESVYSYMSAKGV